MFQLITLVHLPHFLQLTWVLYTSQAAAVAAAGKETPQERLKRLMQAQLNKAAQKDSLANAQKQIQVCKGLAGPGWQNSLVLQLSGISGCAKANPTAVWLLHCNESAVILGKSLFVTWLGLLRIRLQS